MDVLLWFIMIVVFIVVEAATAQLVSIWFAVGSVASVVPALLGVSFPIQLVIFAVASFICLLLLRPLLKSRIAVKTQPTNADRYIGQSGVVVQEIDNDEAVGQVKVMGSIWTARSEDGHNIDKGEKVMVKAINGVKLIVEKV